MDEKINLAGQAETQEEKKEIKTFKLFSSDEVFSDPVVIDYLKICLREFCDANHLVGKFRDDGKYYLQNDIKKDLVQMEKEIALVEEGVFYASNSYMNKNFNFKIVVEKLAENKARAILYLIEDYLDGQQRGQFSTFVASFEEVINGDFNIKVKTAFNLVDSAGDLHETDIPQVAILLHGQKENGIFLDELIELGSQIYVLRMLELLEKAGEKGQEILTDFKEAQKKMEEEESKEEKPDQKKKSKKDIVIDMSVNKKYTKLRKILDQSIQKHGGYEKLPIKKEDLQKNLKTFVEPVKKVEEMRKNYQGQFVEVSAKKKAPEKTAAPAMPAKGKPAGKSASSGGGSSSGGGKKGGDKAKAKPKAKKKDKKDDKKKESAPSYANGGRTIIEEKGQTGKPAGVNATNVATPTAEANIPSVNNPQPPSAPASKPETEGRKAESLLSEMLDNMGEVEANSNEKGEEVFANSVLGEISEATQKKKESLDDGELGNAQTSPEQKVRIDINEINMSSEENTRNLLNSELGGM